MANEWNTGSFVSEIGKYIDNIPSALSGTNMNGTILRSIEYVTNYTGDTISSSSVALKYQNAILFKSCFDLLTSMNLIGIDANTSLGDFNVLNGGADKNVLTSASKWESALKDELRILGRKCVMFKANS